MGTTSETATASRTPSASPDLLLWSDTIVAVRLGDSNYPATASVVGTALPVYFDFYDTRQGIAAGNALAGDSAPYLSVPAGCTLSHGSQGSSSITWFLDTEGQPATTLDGTAVILPCHRARPGSSLAAITYSNKTVAVLRRDRSVETSLNVAAFQGTRGTGSGLRQAASRDARSFYIAGVANSAYGVRYFPPADAPGVPVNVRARGLVIAGSTNTFETGGWYLPGTVDVRGLVLSPFGSNRLLVSSAFSTEPNRNSSAWQQTPWGGVSMIGFASGAPTTSTSNVNLLPGHSGRRNLQSFVFKTESIMWIITDNAVYTRASATSVRAQFTALMGEQVSQAELALSAGETFSPLRPQMTRTNVKSTLSLWRFNPGARVWQEDSSTRVGVNDAAYSLAGRYEGTKFFVYFATRNLGLFRYDVEAASMRRLAAPRANTEMRGAAIPPQWRFSATATPSKTPSNSATRTRSRSRSRSRSPKARGL